MSPDELRALIQRVVVEVVREVDAAPAAARSTGRELPLVRRGPRQRPLPPPSDPGAIAAIKAATPSRVATGRTGTRYLTESYLGLRADHAIAIDAVESELDEAWATERGWLALHSRATDHQDHLLHPDRGRRLDDASRAKAEKDAARGTDVQIIAGDGLSAVALEENGPPLVEALSKTLPAAGFVVGPPIFVKYARIGVQDEIGVLTGAKATLIIVGERPGLGTGDSLSIYTAYGPKLGQDNSEKDCISNVRAMGFVPERAAERCAELFTRTFAAGGGGVRLIQDGARPRRSP